MYKIGEFARNLGVSTGFLKHHESYGLLKPQVAESGYRYYELYQANQAFQCVRLQSMGFTSKEISDILEHSAGLDIPSLFDVKTEEIRQKAAFFQELLSYMEQVGQSFSGRKTDWGIGRPEPFYYMENVSHGQFEGNEKRYEVARRWNAYMPMVELTTRFERLGDDPQPSSLGDWHMGLRIEKPVADRLNIFRNEEVRLVDPGKCLIYRFCGSRKRAGRVQTKPEAALGICGEHGFALSGDIYLLQTFGSNACAESYFWETVLIPIAE